VEASVLLCDHAVVAEGKLYINGGGWDSTTAQTGPVSLAIFFQVGWDETNNRLPLNVFLLDDDGNPVTQLGPDGTSVAVEGRGEFEVGRPPGIKRGSTVAAPLAVQFAPMSLKPDSRYEWRVELGGNTVGHATFRTFPEGFTPRPQK
jgi:hypothetical protein